MSTINLYNTYVNIAYTVGGLMEKEGPLGQYFDAIVSDIYAGEKTFEQAEISLLKQTLKGVFKKGKIKVKDVDLAFGGDLNNQIAITGYTMKDFSIPLIGVYGACSNSMLSLAMAALFVETNNDKVALAFTSSHNQTAEKQFRFPNEYGVQKSPNTTYTVTGAGAVIVSKKPSNVRISSLTFGRIIDSTMDDCTDLGGAMAIAALDTLRRHLFHTDTKPKDYDLIVTGDLSSVGLKVLKEAAMYENIKLDHYDDCGLMIYDRSKQDVFAGGSGCACCALVTYGYLLKLLETKVYKKILVIATGALFSPSTFQQYKTIPTIAHCLCLEAC